MSPWVLFSLHIQRAHFSRAAKPLVAAPRRHQLERSHSAGHLEGNIFIMHSDVLHTPAILLSGSCTGGGGLPV
jgi:hypothetical protein